MTPPTDDPGTGGRSAAPRALVAAVVLAVVLAGCGGPAVPSVDAPSAGSGAASPAPPAHSPTNATDSPTTATHPPPDATDAPMTDFPDGTPPTKHPSLSSDLVGLVRAENPTAYASTWGLALRNGSVRAVVALRDGRDLPAGFDVTVEVRRGDDVQALVAVDDLLPLAEHANVSFVRPPRRAAEGGDDGTG